MNLQRLELSSGWLVLIWKYVELNSQLCKVSCGCLLHTVSMVQDLRVGDVKQIMDLHKQMVPVGLKAAQHSKQADGKMPLHRAISSAPMTGRFSHFGVEQLRIMDVSELYKDFHSLLLLQQ